LHIQTREAENLIRVGKKIIKKMITQKTVSKLLTVIAYLETRDLFKGITGKKQFTEYILKETGETPVEKALKEFFDYIYALHVKTNNPNYVYVNETGDSFNMLIKTSMSSLKKLKSGTTSREITKALFPNAPVHDDVPLRIPKPRNGWINLFIKIADILVKEFA